MASHILGIPAASVGIERQFTDARQMGKYNRKYDPETFSAIMMLRSFYQTENRILRRLIDTSDLAIIHELASTCPAYNSERLRREYDRRRKELSDVQNIMYISDMEDSDDATDSEDDGEDLDVADDTVIVNQPLETRPATPLTSVRASQTRASQTRASQARASQARASQARASQARASQARASSPFPRKLSHIAIGKRPVQQDTPSTPRRSRASVIIASTPSIRKQLGALTRTRSATPSSSRSSPRRRTINEIEDTPTSPRKRSRLSIAM
jgi:hypothetical protein